MATVPPACDFGVAAPDFALPSTGGRIVPLVDVRGLLVNFICNHCPYVLAVLGRI